MIKSDANEAWHDALLRHQLFLLRASGSIRNDVFELLNQTEAALRQRIGQLPEGSPVPARLAKAQKTLSRINQIRSSAWNEVDSVWTKGFKDLTVSEVTFSKSTVENIVPVKLGLKTPSPELINSIVRDIPIEGRTLKEWIKATSGSDVNRINSAIKVGIVQGLTNQEIVQSVLKITQTTRNNVNTLTRTAVNGYTNMARRYLFEENKDVFTEEVFVATLDGRTTAICRSLDGATFPIGEGRIPPLHFGCRSVRVALIGTHLIGSRPFKISTEKSLLKEYSQLNNIKLVSNRDDLPRGHKGRYDNFAVRRGRELIGRVPTRVNYQQFLERQSAMFQDDVLGKTKGILFRKGNLTLDRYVDRLGNELTLKQLVERETKAFIAAGLDPAKYRS